MIEEESRLRVGRAIGKSEGEVAEKLFACLSRRGNPKEPPAVASDGYDYGEALVKAWGEVPEYQGRGRPPTRRRPQSHWRYLQVKKEGGLTIKVVFGEQEEVMGSLYGHTSYVERTHLTSRHMNGRCVRKTISYSKKLAMLEASCAWEDIVFNLARTVKTLRQEVNDGRRRWRQRTPAMAAGLRDHQWTIEEILTVVVRPRFTNS